MLLLLAANLAGPTGAQWARTVTAGTDTSSFGATVADSNGNVYAAGAIKGTGTYNFGNGKTAAGTYGDFNAVLVKYDAAGTAQWARTILAGTNISSFNSIALDSSGNIYAAGQIYGTGTYDFGNGKTATGTYIGGNIVLVKYDAAGTAQWAKTVTAGALSSQFYSVTVDSNNNIFAAGYIQGTGAYNFGGGITATGTYAFSNIVLVKYDSSGTAQWAKTVTAGSDTSVYFSVAADSNGNIYAAGYIGLNGTYDFNNSKTATSPYSGASIVLVKYDSTGTAQWAKTISSGSASSIYQSVAVDSSGNVYAAGFIYGTGTFNFGNGITAAGTYTDMNIILVKYNSSGTPQWANTVTQGSNKSLFRSIYTDNNGSIYAAGIIAGTGTYIFGNNVSAAGAFNGDSNILLLKYDSSGTAQWAKTVSSGTNVSYFNSVAADSTGSIYAAGYIAGTGTFDFGNNITAAGTTSTGTFPYSCLLVKYK